MECDYRILPNKRACLNKRTPQLLNVPGHISETSKPILIKSSALNADVFAKLISLKSGKVEGSFSASAPRTFIRHNTVFYFCPQW